MIPYFKDQFKPQALQTDPLNDVWFKPRKSNLLRYHLKTSVLSISLSHNGTRLDIESTRGQVLMQMVPLPTSVTKRRRNLNERSLAKSQRLLKQSQPGVTHELNDSCIPTLVPSIFGLSQSRRFVVQPEDSRNSTASAHRQSLCDANVYALSIYLCVSGVVSAVLALLFAVHFRNWGLKLGALLQKSSFAI